MPAAIRYWLAAAAAAAALAWSAWPGAPGNPATPISRFDVFTVIPLLAGLPFLIRRHFGPLGDGWVPRFIRAAGYAAVFALVVVKAQVEHVELPRLSGAPLSGVPLAGVWAGEVAFLVVIGAYLCALLAVTAQRPPANPTTLAIGTGVGVAIGIAIYVLRPLINSGHPASPWLGALAGLGKVAAVMLVLFAAFKAAIAAARRSGRRESGSRRPEVRARQGVAAGLCVGIAAALLVSILGISTIALLPHTAGDLQWTLPDNLLAPGRGPTMTPDMVSDFEVSFSQAAAGYLLVLILFPLLGAGLGAWGGLFAEGNSGHAPGGGGGGGGGRGPEPQPVPPGGGLALDWDELTEFPELAHAAQEERVPVGLG